jgi:hypothetical protein
LIAFNDGDAEHAKGVPPSPMSPLAQRVQYFSESVIREMTRLAARHGAINLGQGMPDFDTPQEVKDAACKAIQDGFNQYAITWGAPVLRQAIAAKGIKRRTCHADQTIVCCAPSTGGALRTGLPTNDGNSLQRPLCCGPDRRESSAYPGCSFLG